MTLEELYGGFLIDHTDYYNDQYHQIITKYLGHRENSDGYYNFMSRVNKIIALRDSNSLLPPDLQALFNEWILSRRL